MASIDFIFQGAPTTGTGGGAIPQPGTALAPSVGLDVTNGVGYLNVGSGWVPQAPALVAKKDFAALAASQTTVALYTVPSHMGGMYRISTNSLVTTADSTSLTYGVLVVQYTDNTTGIASVATSAIAATTTNTINTGAGNTLLVNAKGGTAITFSLTANPSGTGDGRFSSHVRCELVSIA